jgi:hypothetical protein
MSLLLIVFVVLEVALSGFLRYPPLISSVNIWLAQP